MAQPVPDIAARIARARRLRGLTQKQAAAQLGVALNTWVRWEHGRTQPRPTRLAAIAQVLGIPLGDLTAPAPETVLDRLLRIERGLDEQRAMLQEVRELMRALVVAVGAGLSPGAAEELARSAQELTVRTAEDLREIEAQRERVRRELAGERVA